MLVVSKVVIDVEDKQDVDLFMNIWFNEVKDDIYDVEDFVDEI